MGRSANPIVFCLTLTEAISARKFMSRYKIKTFSYIFTPMGIASKIEIMAWTGKKKDITDYSKW